MNRWFGLLSLCTLMVIFGLGSPLVAAESRKGIMVWQLEAKTGVSDNDITSISGLLTSKVENYSGRKVVSEADIQTILKGEEQKQRCGVDGTSCIAEIGAALGVPEAVSGDVGRVGTIWVLNLRRINIRTSEVIARTTRQMDGDIDDLMLVIPGAVAEIFGKPQPALPGILSVSSDPEGAIVMSGERELGRTSFKIRLDPGKYTLSIRLEDHLQVDRKVTIQSGKKTPATVTLIAIPMNPYKLYGHVTFWSGLGIAALGGVFTGLSSAKMGEHDSKLNEGDGEGAKSARDTSKVYGGVAIAGYTLGGALMITGTVLWILSPGDEAWARENLLSVGPTDDGGMMISLAGRW